MSDLLDVYSDPELAARRRRELRADFEQALIVAGLPVERLHAQLERWYRSPDTPSRAGESPWLPGGEDGVVKRFYYLLSCGCWRADRGIDDEGLIPTGIEGIVTVCQRCGVETTIEQVDYRRELA